MNEATKTVAFAGIAAALAFGAYLTQTPTSIGVEEIAESRIGEDLFPKFDDPLKIGTFKLVRYNEDLGELSEFELTRDSKGVWVMPSRDSYPADAQEQIGSVANSLVGVRILDVASSRPADQKLFGVVEPDSSQVQVGQTGVGDLVRMLDDNGERLAELIIGKEVKGQPGQRYVRKPGEDQIYVAAVDTTPFVTDFKQWIDKDLLQLSSTDIRQLDIRKYSIQTDGRAAGLVRNFEALVEYDTQGNKWQPEKIVRFNEQGEEENVEVGPDEQLNATKLNAMKTALDSLEIESVRRKPEGLAADLKADASLLDDQSSLLSLQQLGFYVPQGASNNELFSSSGELLTSLEDGVQYLLRFGNEIQLAGSTEGDEAISNNRYLLVTARVNDDLLTPPQLEKVPETIEELDAAEAAAKPPAGASQNDQSGNPSVPPVDRNVTEVEPGTTSPATPDQPSSDQPASDQPPATDESPGENAPENGEASPEESGEANEGEPAGSESPAETEGDQSSRTNRRGERLVLLQEDADEAAAASEDSPAAAESAAEAEPTEESPADESPADQSPAEQVPAADADDAQPATEQSPASAEAETEQEKQERLQAAQERITKANQRKIDEHKERVDTAKKRAAELNARFADWYYIISETQYEKLNISLEELIQNQSEAAAAPASGFTPPPGGIDPSMFNFPN